MTTATLNPSGIRETEPFVRPATTRCALPMLLVATDASEGSDEAIVAAKAIARRHGSRVHLLAVHEPLPVVSPEVQISQSSDDESRARETLRAGVLGQVARLGERTWDLEVRSGAPAATIVDTAERLGASLMVMGLGGHGLFERVLGDEMVLQVVRLGTVPVLAVAPFNLGAPTQVVAATDFSASSIRAVMLGQELMTTGGTLTLTHVMSSDVATAMTGDDSAFHGPMGRAFDEIEPQIRRRDIRVNRMLLSGDPAKAVLAFGNSGTDLIVTGSHGHGFLTRLLLGSVSQRLVRGARCSVLIAPPEEGPSHADELPVATSRFARYEWAERLEDFTRRNRGRLATLEIIDPVIGAQVEERFLSFSGADFDARDANVHIMLADAKDERRHITRNISCAGAIQVLRDRGGKDLMLRVAHGRAQTLVTLV